MSSGARGWSATWDVWWAEKWPPRDKDLLIPGTHVCCLKWQKRLCRWDGVKDLVMGRFCWISQMGPKYNHKAPYNREGRRSKVEGNAVMGVGRGKAM